jgi:3-hydroxyacyl-CoA dehydrogenase
MNGKVALVKRAAVWLIVGLIGGGIAGDQWQRRQAARDHVEATNSRDDQLKDARAKIDELAKALDAERQRRQALEGVLADLRKGS